MVSSREKLGSSQPTKYYSEKQETMIAESLGWQVVSGSGSRACHPGDIVSDEWLGECKTHTLPTDRIVFKLHDWKKICDEAAQVFKYPVLFTDDGSQKLQTTWCMIKLISIPPLNRQIRIITSEQAVSVKSLSIDFRELLYRYSRIFGYDTIGIFQYTWNNESVGILPLTKFIQLFR